MKVRISGIALVCICLIFGLTYQGMAEIDPDTIAGLWLFDDGSGGTVTDSSGNELDGEVIGDVAWVDGVFGKAMEFDGGGGQVKIIDHANPTEAITVSAWAKSAEPTWNQHGWVLEKRDAFMLHNVQGTMDMGWIVVNGGPWNLPFSWQTGAVAPDDITEWHMYTGTFDSATGDWFLYIDGKMESELSLNADPLAEDTGPIHVGNDT